MGKTSKDNQDGNDEGKDKSKKTLKKTEGGAGMQKGEVCGSCLWMETSRQVEASWLYTYKYILFLMYTTLH